ncbi:hypothetical protein LY90DRAFT_513253 [Neocallimastix californiae]|uniref:Uncharacterized protein n=1 Tax=Neocallimastix californiae TaxID=1754190 RepID=A0A1Y2AZD7_9FUNG|nr:hypothetical protein LY90DRAFT_513253 [Neocallimastix californiae]|eukprot:ORY27943.1 hypothetical protein LY90DRAFT_513253 [Neocallimastix californiae]
MILYSFEPLKNGFTCIIRNCTFTNIEQVGEKDSALLNWQENGVLKIYDCKIENAKGLTLKIQHSIINDIMYNGKFFQIYLSQIEIDDLTVYYGFNHGHNSYIYINNTTFSYCNFKRSLFNLDTTLEKRYGKIYVNNTLFNGNRGNNGGVFNMVEAPNQVTNIIDINNCIFENNYAYGYGGVVYSLIPLEYYKINFRDCSFTNNTSFNGKNHTKGSICYSLNQSCEPIFNNKDDIIENCGINSFSFNPSHVSLGYNTPSSLDIYSGQLIKEPLIFVIKDIHDKDVKLKIDINNTDMNKMILYQLEMDDPYNSKIYGGVEGFCFGDVCKISDIRRRFSAFKNTTTEIDINIKVCNTTKYIEKYINDGNIKSCINSNILKYRFKNIYTVYIISIITTYHIIVTIIWTITNSIYTEKVLDESYKEYIECFYPRFEMISSLFNSIILAIGCYFAYETRYAEKRYTESLSIPIYVYLIYHIYSEFLYYQVNVSIKPKDLINSIGTIVYSIIVIKYVYIDKLIYIYSRYCNYMKLKKHENDHYQLKF